MAVVIATVAILTFRLFLQRSSFSTLGVLIQTCMCFCTCARVGTWTSLYVCVCVIVPLHIVRVFVCIYIYACVYFVCSCVYEKHVYVYVALRRLVHFVGALRSHRPSSTLVYTSLTGGLIGGVANAIAILVLNAVYRKAAVILNNWGRF